MANIDPESINTLIRHLKLSGYPDSLDKQHRVGEVIIRNFNNIPPKGFLNSQDVIGLLAELNNQQQSARIINILYDSQYYFFSDDPDFGYIYKHENTLERNNLIPEFKRKPIVNTRMTATQFNMAIDSLCGDIEPLLDLKQVAAYALAKREENRLFKKINDNHYIINNLESFKAALKDYEQTAKTAWLQNTYSSIVLEGHYPVLECLVSFSHTQDKVGIIRAHVIDASTVKKAFNI